MTVLNLENECFECMSKSLERNAYKQQGYTLDVLKLLMDIKLTVNNLCMYYISIKLSPKNGKEILHSPSANEMYSVEGG